METVRKREYRAAQSHFDATSKSTRRSLCHLAIDLCKIANRRRDLYHVVSDATPKEFYKKLAVWCETLKMINEAILFLQSINRSYWS